MAAGAATHEPMKMGWASGDVGFVLGASSLWLTSGSLNCAASTYLRLVGTRLLRTSTWRSGMDPILERGAGLDVHQSSITACVRCGWHFALWGFK